ncbi:MAG: aminodeoxychorismate synthase component I [Endomicrobiales bacterium]|nr:aminodeoxychorismate synthase component I [Endomicrobiales bacterium]
MRKPSSDNFVILETNKPDAENRRSFIFKNPARVISCRRLADVGRTLSGVEKAVREGYWAAGFVAYEAGFAFEHKLSPLAGKNYGFPLVWFGIYAKPASAGNKGETREPPGSVLTDFRANIGFRSYDRAIKKIKGLIRKGDTYQINFTYKYGFGFSGSALDLYRRLAARQRTSYSAFIKFGNTSVLSLSPELFFRKKGQKITVKPMKGTAPRGRNAAEDSSIKRGLERSLKNRSENVMIVDLLRNDLSRICEPGSVKTRGLFEIEKYGTLFQMVSTVEGRLKQRIGTTGVFAGIFPSGSVTGAPKIRSMEIINNLEKEPRGIYTGCVGFISPKGEAVFNVAIRTIVIDEKKCRGEMGSGSGIVMDSDARKEYDECALKAKFLEESSGLKPGFKLIESVLWRRPGGYCLLGYHMDRIRASAKALGVKLDAGKLKQGFRRLEKRFSPAKKYKVRSETGIDGRTVHSYSEIGDDAGMKRAIFSKFRVNSGDMYLYHKTNIRKIYDSELKKYSKRGFFDVFFTNERGEVTEGARSNIFVLKKGRYYTPPVACGLLPGVFRRDFMKKHRVIEKVLYPRDLYRADKVFFGNSVRGLVEIKFDRHQTNTTA